MRQVTAESAITSTESFLEYFDMVPADTESLKQEVYRLRYQVYCVETGFEDAEKFPRGMEKDEYDDTSDHYLIRHRQTGAYAATTRLILPDPSCPKRPFPIERNARIEIPSFLGKIPRAKMAEASRFCVSKDFKRRRGEAGTQAGLKRDEAAEVTTAASERRTFPHISIALIACLVRMSLRNGITHWYGFVEMPLIRLFSNFGIQFMPIGPISEYHGMRQPTLIKIPEYLEPTKAKNIEIWNMLTNSGRFWQDDTGHRRQPSGVASSGISRPLTCCKSSSGVVAPHYYRGFDIRPSTVADLRR